MDIHDIEHQIITLAICKQMLENFESDVVNLGYIAGIVDGLDETIDFLKIEEKERVGNSPPDFSYE